MSVPLCECKVRYELADAKFPATVEHCALHRQAAELFEIVDGLVNSTEQVVHHQACRCLHCRSVRAIYKARAIQAPERTDEAEVQRRGPRIVGGS